jgi:hypothetical protein
MVLRSSGGVTTMSGSIAPGVFATLGLGLAAGGAVSVGAQWQRNHDQYESDKAGEAALEKQGVDVPHNWRDRSDHELWLTEAAAGTAVLGTLAATLGKGGVRYGGLAALGAAAIGLGSAYLMERSLPGRSDADARDMELQLYRTGEKAATTNDKKSLTPTVESVGKEFFARADVTHDGQLDASDAARSGFAASIEQSMGGYVVDEAGFTDRVVRPEDANRDGHIDSGELSTLTDKILRAASQPSDPGPDTSSGSNPFPNTQNGSGNVPTTAPPGGWTTAAPRPGYDAGGATDTMGGGPTTYNDPNAYGYDSNYVQQPYDTVGQPAGSGSYVAPGQP